MKRKSYTELLIAEVQELLKEIASMKQEVINLSQNTDRARTEISEIHVSIQKITLDGIEITLKEKGEKNE